MNIQVAAFEKELDCEKSVKNKKIRTDYTLILSTKELSYYSESISKHLDHIGYI